jgi:gamma-glutamylputrescine oxidase
LASISFWQQNFLASPDLHHRFGQHPEPLQGSHEAEVAIIGAGITGTAAALWLARAGVVVSVLEARGVAAAASGRNGGFIADGTTGSYASAIARHGREQARRLWAFSVENHRLAEQFIAELEEQGWPCDYRRNGSCKLAASEQELAAITSVTALLKEDGWEAHIISREELPARLRESYYGGAYFPASGELHPVRFVAGLAWLARQAGALIYGDSPVTAITLHNDGILLTTPRGTLRAQKLILAANAWLPELSKLIDKESMDWLARAIIPTRGQVIATGPLGERIIPCPCSADEGYQYWRQLPDGRLIVGGWRNRSFETEAQTYDESPFDGVQHHLDAFVHETLHLPEVRIESRWAGIMGFTPDGLPLVGPLPGIPNCYICGGYTGHGNAFAIHAAKLVGEIAMGRKNEDAELFAPERFV